MTTTGDSEVLISTLVAFSLFLALPSCLVWCMKEGEGFTGGSLKAIREQHTDRMRAVNRGKQGRAEDTVTL